MYHFKKIFPIAAILILGITNLAMPQKNSQALPIPPDLQVVLGDSSDWWMQDSWHFKVYGRPLSQVYKDFNAITDSLERSLNRITKLLNIRDAGLIQWYGFPDPLDSKGNIGKAHPDFGLVFSTYNDTLRYFATTQVTQVLLGRSWGIPKSPFMSEGLAVALEGWVGLGNERQRLQEVVGDLSKQGKIPNISRLVRDFNTYPSKQSYAIAASFLDFLLNRYGVAPIKALYVLAREDNFAESFERIYGHPLSEVEQEWRQTIK